jgi:hypothetical protein
MSRAA